MKTKEEIIDKIFMDAIGEENTMKLSLIILELIHDCMSEYATDQTAKWRELCEAWKEFHLLNELGDLLYGQGLIRIMELRQKISELEKELNIEK